MSDVKARSNSEGVEQIRAAAIEALDFWATFGSDGSGGWNVRLNSDGTPYESSERNVVAAARFVVNFSLGALAFNSSTYREAAISAFDYLQTRFTDDVNGGYFWKIRGSEPFDTRKLAYGHAFVLLAAANATKADLPGSEEELLNIAGIAERRFFNGEDLTWDTADADWSNVGILHSNNPNMHFCEAFIAAFEATGNQHYLERALRIARAIAKSPSSSGRPIWENYDANWKPLPSAPVTVDRASMQSPVTALPGHLAEWAKLLAILHLHAEDDWLLDASRTQYRLAWDTGWDDDEGGFFAGLNESDEVVWADKHYWAPPEALGAAALLERVTGDERYRNDRVTVWNYMESNMRDPIRGGWFKQPGPLIGRTDMRKGDEYDPDYHALGGCFEVLGVIRP